MIISESANVLQQNPIIFASSTTNVSPPVDVTRSFEKVSDWLFTTNDSNKKQQQEDNINMESLEKKHVEKIVLALPDQEEGHNHAGIAAQEYEPQLMHEQNVVLTLPDQAEGHDHAEIAAQEYEPQLMHEQNVVLTLPDLTEGHDHVEIAVREYQPQLMHEQNEHMPQLIKHKNEWHGHQELQS